MTGDSTDDGGTSDSGSGSNGRDGPGRTPQEQPAQRNPAWHFTVVTSAFTLATAYSPYTLGAAGWGLGSAFWAYSIGATWWSGVLIGRCVLDGRKRGVPSTYPEMMRDAFGLPGFCFAAVMQVATYYMLCVALLVNIANWLLLMQAIVRPEAPAPGGAPLRLCLWQWIIVAGCVATLLAQVKTFRSVMPLAVVSAVSTLARQGILYYQIGSQDLLSRCAPSFGGVTPQSAFNSLATTGFLFGGHGIFPEEMRELRRPESFFKALHWAYAIMVAVYLTNAYVAYAVWGDWVAGDVQFNWPLNRATLASAILSCVWALIGMAMSHVMMLSLVEQRIEACWRARASSEVAPPPCSAAVVRLARFSLRAAVVWSEVFFAVMLSGAGIENIQALVGALGFPALTYYAPFAAYWRLLAKRESAWLQVGFLLVGLSGTCLMIFGVYSSLAGIAEDMRTYSLFDTSKCSSSAILNVSSCSNPCHSAYGDGATCIAA
uniref:Amino acid transporter transmembrane domain-containing protein n=1 Tax=Alexandrium monilatum TaxID=311494 RepID=A0A7S4SZJ8_9DINO